MNALIDNATTFKLELYLTGLIFSYPVGLALGFVLGW